MKQQRAIYYHNKKMLAWLAGMLTAFLFAMSIGNVANAQVNADDVHITMSPTSSKLLLSPGTQHEGTFKVVNSGGTTFDFTVYAAPYTVSDEAYNALFEQETSRTQISRWVTFARTKYSLKPGEEALVPYRVDIPKDVATGGQYAALFAETVEPAAEGTGVVTKKRVGTLLYATINGDTRESGKLVEVKLPAWQHDSSLSTTWRVQNSGNTDFTTSPKLTIKSLFGDKTLHESKATTPTVLPDTTRAMELSWQEAGIGVYRATASVEFLGKVHVQERLVLVAPSTIVIGVAILLAAIVGGIVYGGIHRHRTKKRSLRR